MMNDGDGGKIDGVEPDIEPRDIKWERPRFFSPRAILVYFLMAVFWFLFFFIFRGC
ncbi:MAG: hypothetical protein ABIH66_09990 [bacterium]